MKRVMIIGCCGSGKSTLAVKLNRIINVDIVHLDQYYWKPNWVEPHAKEWIKTVKELASKEEWIIDGNYSGTLDIRMKKADTIIYLDYSTKRCLWRILNRIRKYYGRVRPDMPEGCKERFDIGFLHYVATFNLRKRKKLMKKLELHKGEKSVIVLESDKDVNVYLNSIRNTVHNGHASHLVGTPHALSLNEPC